MTKTPLNSTEMAAKLREFRLFIKPKPSLWARIKQLFTKG
jgi:hypothetical protein